MLLKITHNTYLHVLIPKPDNNKIICINNKENRKRKCLLINYHYYYYYFGGFNSSHPPILYDVFTYNRIYIMSLRSRFRGNKTMVLAKADHYVGLYRQLYRMFVPRTCAYTQLVTCECIGI